MPEKSKAFVEKLREYAWEYIEECISNTKEVVSNKGTIVDQKDRHIPTTDYFLRIWIPLNYSQKDTIKRSTYYRWLNWANTEKQAAIKDIDDVFKALATDIVANEGKGIFYAKNKLGMTDKAEVKSDNSVKLTGELGVTVVSSGVPLANKESDVGTV
jgi:hypothetical protein